MQEITLTIPGFSIAAKVWGNSKNPPILALHGWLDNANSFAPLAPYLQNDFYLIAVDLPGHGLSSHLPPGCNYHFFDGIFIIIAIINALKLERVHLLGHSMGACMSSLMAGVAPERLHSLYLIEALGPFSSPAQTACSQLTDYAQFLNHTHRLPKGYDQFESAALARSQKGYVSMDIARILCERGLIEKKGRFYWRHDRRLIAPTPLRMTEEQVLSCLQNISVKTHLLLSNEGFAFDVDIMENRIKAVKNMVVERLAGGHHIHMEKPELIGKLLIEFYN
ncbi:alpha/beta fold hydrolase [Legionella saoudiensis]|uniref:alpha/beta fold hydrolase n=1 Tax=Legionella saoudiensis TaxID=1750561 RepID=UPI00072FACF4|nr:alpha/beta hydrolase [Legionella saoudiensis]